MEAVLCSVHGDTTDVMFVRTVCSIALTSLPVDSGLRICWLRCPA